MKRRTPGILALCIMVVFFGGCAKPSYRDEQKAIEKRWEHLKGQRLRDASDQELLAAAGDRIGRALNELLDRGDSSVELYVRSLETERDKYRFQRLMPWMGNISLPGYQKRILALAEKWADRNESSPTHDLLMMYAYSAGPADVSDFSESFGRLSLRRFGLPNHDTGSLMRIWDSLGGDVPEDGPTDPDSGYGWEPGVGPYGPASGRDFLYRRALESTLPQAPMRHGSSQAYTSHIQSLQIEDREAIGYQWSLSPVEWIRRSGEAALIGMGQKRSALLLLRGKARMEPGKLDLSPTEMDKSICEAWVRSGADGRDAFEITSIVLDPGLASKCYVPYLKSANEEYRINAILGLAAVGDERALAPAWELLKNPYRVDEHGFKSIYKLLPVLNAICHMTNPNAQALAIGIAEGAAGPSIDKQLRVNAYENLNLRSLSPAQIERALAFIEEMFAEQMRVGNTTGGAWMKSEIGRCIRRLPPEVRVSLIAKLKAKYGKKSEIEDEPTYPTTAELRTLKQLPQNYPFGPIIPSAGDPSITDEDRAIVMRGLRTPRVFYRLHSEAVAASWHLPEASDPIRRDLGLWHFEIRSGAAYAASLTGDKTLAPDVAKLADDPRWQIRRCCAIALGKLDPVGQKAVLQKLSKDPAIDVVEAARAALQGRMPPLRSVSDRVWIPLAEVDD